MNTVEDTHDEPFVTLQNKLRGLLARESLRLARLRWLLGCCGRT